MPGIALATFTLTGRGAEDQPSMEDLEAKGRLGSDFMQEIPDAVRAGG
ncbi:hypothetical protein [Mesorhizobium australicum]|uniref:Uncharacterized protein n=1 Tax=Mesorhizobium australicum TaxID=536018 RepID=A0A1X7P1R9_9HYPH|nr:hypothetical protein [Mesorhizobium australicum]SMH44095.1 hypothetical protein SAMN02982922_3016 [Mesorhizobium australicum]